MWANSGGIFDFSKLQARLAEIEGLMSEADFWANKERAQKNVEDTLVKYPDISGLVGLYSYNGPAILNAVKRSGKVGAVKIVCFDEQDETLAGVAAGSIYGTVVIAFLAMIVENGHPLLHRRARRKLLAQLI